jgi:ABC-2 type transport system permease protein
MKTSLRTVWTFARIDIKRTFRDRVALFFVFLFPLIFLFVFGGIFGGNNDLSFKVAVLNNSQSDFSRRFVDEASKDNVFEINQDVTTRDQAEERLKRSEIDAAIILPETFGQVEQGKAFPSGQAVVLYSPNNEQAGQTLSAILGEVFKGINAQFVATEVPFTVKTESTATASQSRFDYTFAGLLGFSILSLGIFGPTNVFPQLKKQGVLRRLHTTTLRVWQLFVANVISTAFTGILSVALLFVAALVFFDLNMNGDYLSLIAMVILGTTVLFGIGLAVGGWAKNENQAAPLANLVTFPMMFLSGTFFPRFLMPEWLQAASGLLPLTPVIDGIRLIVTEGKSILELGPQVALLVGWALIVYFIAFRVFRWE